MPTAPTSPPRPPTSSGPTPSGRLPTSRVRSDGKPAPETGATELPHAPTMPPAPTDPVEVAPSPPPAPARRKHGPVWWAFAILQGLLGLVLVVAAILYIADYPVHATVQRVDCSTGDVLVETTFGLDHTVRDVPLDRCLAMRTGNFVEFHIRSTHTRLFDTQGGTCLYYSETGVC